MISENAAVGVYYFKKGSEFVSKGNQMVDNEMTVNNEFYICPIYNLFIDDKSLIKIKEVEKMHVLGTPRELEFYTKNVFPKFGDRKVALACDHSGFKIKEMTRRVLEDFGVPYVDFATLVNKG